MDALTAAMMGIPSDPRDDAPVAVAKRDIKAGEVVQWPLTSMESADVRRFTPEERDAAFVDTSGGGTMSTEERKTGNLEIDGHSYATWSMDGTILACAGAAAGVTLAAYHHGIWIW